MHSTEDTKWRRAFGEETGTPAMRTSSWSTRSQRDTPSIHGSWVNFNHSYLIPSLHYLINKTPFHGGKVTSWVDPESVQVLGQTSMEKTSSHSKESSINYTTKHLKHLQSSHREDSSIEIGLLGFYKFPDPMSWILFRIIYTILVQVRMGGVCFKTLSRN